MAAARNNEYIIKQIDKAINEIVFHKFKLLKAYNYYNGKRDAELFRYLEENFGIGNPTLVEFTPLIKKHVDALLGEYLDIPTIAKVSCKDSLTLSNINRDKLLQIKLALINVYKENLNNLIIAHITGKEAKDPAIEKQIQIILDNIDNNFISEYEIAAQHVLDYVSLSRVTNLNNNKLLLLKDLLIGGCAMYRVKPSLENTNISIEVLDPLNTFIDRNPESIYVLDGYRAVIRKWRTKELILTEFGDKMTKEAIAELEDMVSNYDLDTYMYVTTHLNSITHAPMEGDLDNGKRVVPGFPDEGYETFTYKLFPVYEVEWIDTDKINGKYVLNRYEGIRIGQSIYIPLGLSDRIIRTLDSPRTCKLSIGGTYIMNRDNLPTSLVLQCCNLQDKYDIIIFLRDNLLANSGTLGDWLDVSMLPLFLGSNMTERILKWLAYKKAGTALIDSSQEGRGFNNNTFMSGFDDATKVQAILAFEIVLDRIENQVTSITGVFRERLNGITLRDAVSNIEAGAKNSFTITKPFYLLMDTLVVDLLSDCINIAKIVWKNGLTGSIVLGDHLLKIFKILPEYFSFTDYDIHIISSTQILKELEQLRSTCNSMILAGMLEPDLAAQAISCRSLTEMKNIIAKGWAKKKEELNTIGQLQQLLELAAQQLKLLETLNQTLQLKLGLYNELKLLIEQQRLALERDIRWYEAETDRTYKQNKAEVDKDKVKIELEQLRDNNPYNDLVRFDR